MFGKHIGRLQVSIVLYNPMGQMERVTEPYFIKNGSIGQSWQQALIDMPIDQNLQILFYASRGTSFESDIAIDDIKLHEGSCSNVRRKNLFSTTVVPETQAPFCKTNEMSCVLKVPVTRKPVSTLDKKTQA